MNALRWGVLGAGWIADKMVAEVNSLTDHAVVAVGSRSAEKAQAFASEHQIDRPYGSYEDLCHDEHVQAVYVATVAGDHVRSARIAIEAGKTVLVEKPFTLDAAEARQLVETAKQRGTFLMEAMWTRFLPHVVEVRRLLEERTLGDIQLVIADHCQKIETSAPSRLNSLELGGGALLDFGVYPVSMSSLVLGSPSSVVAVSAPAATGVDRTTSILLGHASGAQSVLATSMAAQSSTRATIIGSAGRIDFDPWFFTPTGATLTLADGSARRIDPPTSGNGLRYEVAEVSRCLSMGLTQSPHMPLDESVAIMATLDEVRRQIGLEFPKTADHDV